MNVTPVTHSSFPKNDDSLTLKKAYDSFEKGKIDADSLAHTLISTRREIIKVQQNALMERITDGMVGWIDEVNPFLGRLSGTEPGDMQRYFNTNTLFRKPVVNSLPNDWTGYWPLSTEAADLEREVPNQFGRKVCLTGPYTLSKMCVDRTGSGMYFANRMADAVAAQLLNYDWPVFIQINEPAIIFNPQDADVFEIAWRRLNEQIQWAAQKWRYRICLSIHYGPITPTLWHFLKEINWRGYLGLDLVEGPENIDYLKKFEWTGPLQLGVIDAKSTKMENESDVCELLERVRAIPTISANDVLLTTSCGLEFLPWVEAAKKLALTSLTCQQWNISCRRAR